ncbi:redoxin domain-containing protein [Roseicella frigidaeris]|uniref:Thioredoxin domain-containing protein n=1 Tax=Roseicella frigidaeris TaxID=2230885 RepID=A0A327LWN2_9PROT|nr:redoxin domain-containing protein [Roseicella frigidaeris]RAI54604.1 hypothetical protein DOO78_25820 [Roseicella frigidaeris]
MPERRTLLRSLLAGATLALPLAPRGIAQIADAPAPDFPGIADWLNADVPPSLAALRGRVVLIDVWTYSCINCRRTVPSLNRLQAEYGVAGLQVIGIHTPEFGFERQRPDVEAAVRSLGIRFPVGQDNGFQSWRAWGIRAWPSFLLLDQTGRIVLRREGEGHMGEIEAAIRALLGLPPGAAGRAAAEDPDLSGIRTPEIHFGARGGPASAAYALDGRWSKEAEALVLRSAEGGLRLRFHAAKLHLVCAAPEPAALRVVVDDGTPATVTVERPTLYTLYDGESYAEHRIEVRATAPGLTLYSATFG